MGIFATSRTTTRILRALAGGYVLLLVLIANDRVDPAKRGCPRLYACSTTLPVNTGIGSAYTLTVTTCNYTTTAGTDDDIGLYFCQGGTFCSPSDKETVSGTDGLDEIGAVVDVPVTVGYEPTTMLIDNPGIDAWCLSAISWRVGDNLLGESGEMWFDSQFNVDLGCSNGLISPGSSRPCQQSWKFFNLNGADGYTYDVKVNACEGTKSATVQAAFCSTSWCSTDYGEMVYAILTMSDVDGGQTKHEVEVPFNPVAMKLFEVDSDWCADAMRFNGFTMLETSTSVADFDDADDDGTRTMTISNIQFNGIAQTPSPTTSPTPAPTQERKADTPWVFVALAYIALFFVLVVAGIRVIIHFNNPRNGPLGQAFRNLVGNGRFWAANTALLGLVVTVNVLDHKTVWGIVIICAVFVVWYLVVAWFLVF